MAGKSSNKDILGTQLHSGTKTKDANNMDVEKVHKRLPIIVKARKYRGRASTFYITENLNIIQSTYNSLYNTDKSLSPSIHK